MERFTKMPPSVRISLFNFFVFSLVAISFGLIDQFSVLREFLRKIPVLSLIPTSYDVVRMIFPHWWEKMPFFGLISFIVGLMSLIAVFLLWQLKRTGVIIAIAAFLIAFVINLYVGLHPWLHAVVGTMVGILLIPPVLFAWKFLTKMESA